MLDHVPLVHLSCLNCNLANSKYSFFIESSHPTKTSSIIVISSNLKDSLSSFLDHKQEPAEMMVGILPSLWLYFSFFILQFMTNSSFLIASSSSSNPPTPLAPPPQSLIKPNKGGSSAPFRPSIAVIVGVLTTVFSVTFLLLLYAKHCRRGHNNPFSGNSGGGYPPVNARKNSGIDRGVIESLPIFRFGSLRGQKDGLECAVCLNRFECTEVLRLLPKCKHAFHVECVDTWLDAHSTCPLCRYRVDPEDILLVEDNRILYQTADSTPSKSSSLNHPTPELLGSISRVSGRHSFAGNSLEVIVETSKPDTASLVPRRSLDSWKSRKKRHAEIVGGAGCFDRPRKDELLLSDNKTVTTQQEQQQRRLEHRIIISGQTTENETDGPNHRWSDVQPSDLLFLRSEMILSESSRRISGSRGSRPSFSAGGGRNAINTRSVSEITGMSRFIRSSNNIEDETEQHRLRQREQQRRRRQEEQRKRQAGVVSRWLAWISQSQNQHQPAVPLHPTAAASSSSSSSSSSAAVSQSLVIVE